MSSSPPDELRNQLQAIIFDAAVDYANNGSRNFYDDADEVLKLFTTKLLEARREGLRRAVELIGEDDKAIQPTTGSGLSSQEKVLNIYITQRNDLRAELRDRIQREVEKC
jgi:hypothetical protein